MEKKKYLFGGLAIVGLAGAGFWLFKREKNYLPLEVVPDVDIKKYQGQWYEIARLPARFEKKCYGSKANYTLNSDGSLTIENFCYKGSLQGELKKVQGRGVVDSESSGKLKVFFWGPFSGDYWILDIGKNYEYALVGEPSRKYLWILSRTPSLQKSTIEQLIQKAINRGFNTHQLIFTKHKEGVKVEE